MSGYQLTLKEWLEKGKLSVPNTRKAPGAPTKKRPREPNAGNYLANAERPPNTKRARINNGLAPPTVREAEMLTRGAPRNPRRQHQARSRVYGTLTRDKKIAILNYLAEQVRQGNLDPSQFESIKRFIMRSQYANNILNVVPQAEGLLTRPGVANNKMKLESRFNRANAKRIMEQFQRGNVENPEIQLETDEQWEEFVNDLVKELGVIRINNNYSNDEEMPAVVETTIRAVENVLKHNVPFGRQLTFESAGGSTRRRRRGSKRRRTARHT